ncbi:MAG: acylphosphatase [Phycisphaerales bacterium]|nr:MAG: acylphosphatase [Phycisphaerales bacterium]
MSQSRYDIRFTGRVQGVGFRMTAQRVARDYTVAGWVRNEPDGSVRCVTEGETSELDRFVEAVQHAMAGNIQDTQIQRSTATGEFTEFSIRH